MKNIRNKNAVVTGGASGIGKAIALKLAEQGCNLILADLQDASELVQQIQSMNVKACSFIVDVSDPEEYKRFSEKAIEAFGGVDIVVNNAGFMQGGAAQDYTLEQWHKITDVNIHGVYYGVHFFLPHLLEKGSGHIVNTASLFGLAHLPFVSSYCMTKAAVVGFSNSIRAELDHQGIGVTSICPGSVQTNLINNGTWHDSGAGNMIPDMFAKHKTSTPEDVANAVLKGITKNKRQVLVGQDAKLLAPLIRWMPNVIYNSFSSFGKKTMA